MVDAVIDDPSRNLRDIRISEDSRVAVVLTVDYDSAIRIWSQLPSGRDLDGHGSRVPAESKGRGKGRCVNKDRESIFTGFEVDGLNVGGVSASRSVAVGHDRIGT